MRMVEGGFDVHRGQITVDVVDLATGELFTGRVRPATREGLGAWLERMGIAGGDVALEATTGWRFVVEELAAVGVVPHLGDTGELHQRRSSKKRAKTDRSDARRLRELLSRGELPEVGVPPPHLLDLRDISRARRELVVENRVWKQRVQALLLHHGYPRARGLASKEGRQRLQELALAPGAAVRMQVALEQISRVTAAIAPLTRQLQHIGKRQPGCRALQERIFGMGPVSSTAFVAEVGDCRRFRSLGQVVRFCGLDITVWSSDRTRPPGHLSRQGPELVRWALYEAAKSAAQPASPYHGYYLSLTERLTKKEATLSVARVMAKQAARILAELGDDAIAPWEG